MPIKYKKTTPKSAYGKAPKKQAGVKKKRRKVVNRKRTRGKA